MTPARADTAPYDAFTDALRQLIDGSERMGRAQALARRYWSEPFSGRFFHVFADDEHPNEITSNDIVAVSTLSVTIPMPVAIWLLDEGREVVTAMLHGIPTDVDVWNAGESLDENGDAWALWRTLSSASWPTANPSNEMGQTKISKLIAAKRPRLVPIYDSVLRELLPKVPDYWKAFATALSDEQLRLALAIACGAGAPEDATLLRKLDAMLWMIGKQTDW